MANEREVKGRKEKYLGIRERSKESEVEKFGRKMDLGGKRDKSKEIGEKVVGRKRVDVKKPKEI